MFKLEDGELLAAVVVLGTMVGGYFRTLIKDIVNRIKNMENNTKKISDLEKSVKKMNETIETMVKQKEKDELREEIRKELSNNSNKEHKAL